MFGLSHNDKCYASKTETVFEAASLKIVKQVCAIPFTCFLGRRTKFRSQFVKSVSIYQLAPARIVIRNGSQGSRSLKAIHLLADNKKGKCAFIIRNWTTWSSLLQFKLPTLHSSCLCGCTVHGRGYLNFFCSCATNVKDRELETVPSELTLPISFKLLINFCCGLSESGCVA